MNARLGLILYFACASIGNGVPARAADGTIDYHRDVRPILSQRCYACHGALKQEAGLRLDTVAAMKTGGQSGAAIAPAGDTGNLLLERIRSTDMDTRMPPEGKPLQADEIALIEQWIASGAIAPANDAPQPDPLRHWAFRLPEQLTLPHVVQFDGQLPSNPIDRWLAAKAHDLGVVPLPEASKRELIRRLSVDLIGLPPEKEEVDRFLGDPAPDAYLRLVDRLLSRPEYGERWGRHWMDVWRYSDWYGRRSVPDVMNSYPQIWRWRDWIVRSLNDDMGYDRMLTEMLAADEVAPTDDDNLVATGFIVRNWYKWNYETWMKDCVEHTGKAFLGLTFNCAQCHDHKFDPITQEDYFRFRAFFEPLELRHDRVAGEPDPGPFKKYVYAQSYGPIASGAIRVFDEKLDAQTFMFSGGDARNRIEGKPPVECGPPRSLSGPSFEIVPVELPPEAHYPGLKSFVRQDELSAAHGRTRAAAAHLEACRRALAAAAAKVEDGVSRPDRALEVSSAAEPTQPVSELLLDAQRAASEARLAVRVAEAKLDAAEASGKALRERIAADDAKYYRSGSAELLARLASRAEREAGYQAAFAEALVAEQESILAQRLLAGISAAASGSSSEKPSADKVEAAKKAAATAEAKLQSARAACDSARTKLANDDSTYTPLSPSYPARSTGRRSALARWLVSSDNPLTARVAINHIWLRHFGIPLVETVDNFGVQGKPPAHPELLDWLAVELVRNNWSMKQLHRLIVTSQAYRRRSYAGQVDHQNAAADRDNLSYWHFPARRMEAEVVRDSVLACAGMLDRAMGGREIDIDQWIKTPRRSLYFTQHGESQMTFLSAFDGANVCECYRRTSTVLPSQALALSNSELLVQASRQCAERLGVQMTSTAASSHLVDVSNNLVDVSSNLVDRSTNSVGSASKLPDASSGLSKNGLQLADETSAATRGTSVEGQGQAPFVQLAFETLLGRPPTESERQSSLEFFAESLGAAGQAQSSEAQETLREARATFIMALFNHNEFVTVR